MTACQIEFYEDGDWPDDPADWDVPNARIYQHCDGNPEEILPRLNILRNILETVPAHNGNREDDPEWAAAEYISAFRPLRSGNIYVTQDVQPDIQYTYRVICKAGGWKVLPFVAHYNFGTGEQELKAVA